MVKSVVFIPRWILKAVQDDISSSPRLWLRNAVKKCVFFRYQWPCYSGTFQEVSFPVFQFPLYRFFSGDIFDLFLMPWLVSKTFYMSIVKKQLEGGGGGFCLKIKVFFKVLLCLFGKFSNGTSTTFCFVGGMCCFFSNMFIENEYIYVI